MEKGFEDFIERHFDQFGTLLPSPSPEIWRNMEKRLITYHALKRRKARVLLIISVSVAAACILAAFLVIHSGRDGSDNKKEFAVKKRIPDSSQKKYDSSESFDVEPAPPNIALPAEYSASINHYWLSIEQKQKQLDSLRKKDPELYRSFKNASAALKSLYHSLQAKLPASPDRSKILLLMIENLKIQESALNNQLELLMDLRASDINHQKSAYQ